MLYEVITHLRQLLPPRLGHLIQGPYLRQGLVGQLVGFEELAATGGPGVGRDARQVTIGQHATGQRREGDAARNNFV